MLRLLRTPSKQEQVYYETAPDPTFPLVSLNAPCLCYSGTNLRSALLFTKSSRREPCNILRAQSQGSCMPRPGTACRPRALCSILSRSTPSSRSPLVGSDNLRHVLYRTLSTPLLPSCILPVAGKACPRRAERSTRWVRATPCCTSRARTACPLRARSSTWIPPRPWRRWCTHQSDTACLRRARCKNRFGPRTWSTPLAGTSCVRRGRSTDAPARSPLGCILRACTACPRRGSCRTWWSPSRILSSRGTGIGSLPRARCSGWCCSWRTWCTPRTRTFCCRRSWAGAPRSTALCPAAVPNTPSGGTGPRRETLRAAGILPNPHGPLCGSLGSDTTCPTRSTCVAAPRSSALAGFEPSFVSRRALRSWRQTLCGGVSCPPETVDKHLGRADGRSH
mmetsp:Transcript_38092/g.73039  ORF Transcript_38092/g.73039 Transcript_38092/m.73039 type:complete len:393 (+) Transcript_38092:79-1257(+)